MGHLKWPELPRGRLGEEAVLAVYVIATYEWVVFLKEQLAMYAELHF